MSKTIFLRVGNKEAIVLPDLVTSLSSFLRVLRDFDSTVSDRKGGSQQWEVTSIAMASPVTIGVTPAPKPRMPDLSYSIESTLLESTIALTNNGERTSHMSDSALQGIKQIANLSPRIGPSLLYVAANGQPQRESPINEATKTVVSELTGVKYIAFGTLTGTLEAISVHGRSEFRIWDEFTGKVVRCRYTGDKIEKRILASLRKKVSVTGEISSNSAGTPISLTVEDVEESDYAGELPTIRELAGFIKDYTGGRRLKDYLREIADE